jgi:Kef-type K+ transport system membrane component KefB
MNTLLLFTVVMFVLLLFPRLLNRLGIPNVTAEIAAGILVGPYGFGLIEPNSALKAIAQLGLVFLMFLAGMEMDPQVFRGNRNRTVLLTCCNGGIPFLGGLLVGRFFGLGWLEAVLLGSIFTSSSVGIVIPVFREIRGSGERVQRMGDLVISAVVIMDILSLLVLSVVVRIQAGGAGGIWLFILSAVLFLAAVLYLVPKIGHRFFRLDHGTLVHFETEVRFILFVLLLVTFLAEVLHVHAIVGAFLAGVALSETFDVHACKDCEEKLTTLGYSFFIPIFFLVMGMETNLGVLFQARENLFITVTVVLGLICTKAGSGALAGTLLGMPFRESLGMGFATIPQLSATLAAAAVGRELGLLNEAFFVAIVVLSIVTTMISPVVTRRLLAPRRPT